MRGLHAAARSFGVPQDDTAMDLMINRVATLFILALASPAFAAPVSFTNQIKPILATRCEECHSGDEPDAKYDVTTYANLLNEGEKGWLVLVARKPDESAIVQFPEGTRKPRMPKKKPPL